MSPYLTLGLLTVSCVISLQVWNFLRPRGDDSRSARMMGWLMLDTALWAGFNVLELASSDFSWAFVFANIQYIAISTIPVVWFRFGTRLLRGDDTSRARLMEAETWQWLPPVVTALLVWTDPWWGLVRSNLEWSTVEGLSHLSKNFGPWFWAHSAYSYVLLVWGTARVALSMRHRAADARWQAVLLGSSALFPMVANLSYVTGWWPFDAIDPTPIAFMVTGLLFVLTLSRFRFLALLPVAQDAVVDGLEQVVFLVDLNDRLVYLNRAAEKVFGLNRLEVGQPMSRLRAANPGVAALASFQDLPVSGRTDELALGASGARFEVHLGPVLRAGRAIAYAYTGHNVTQRANELHETHRQLFHSSLHDPLTGLANRSLLLNRLEQTLLRYQREPQHRFALLFINFDNFKQVNESFGHAAGDALLRESASRLTAAVRAVDTVSRLGSDEFVVLLDRVTGVEDALDVANRIADDLSVPLRHGGDTLVPSTSIGVLTATPDYSIPEELLRDAEFAVDAAKQVGGACCAVFDPDMRTRVQERTRLKNDLGKAILEGEIEVHYQPVVRLSDGVTVGCEALARWTHPSLGRIGPDRFIPVAEESGLIVPLGLVVLRAACQTAVRLAREFPGRPLFIAVNVSSMQLAQPGFATVVESCLAEYGVTPAQLHLEITESALVQNPEAVKNLLQGLVDRGFHFKLDDFGTGYSSLAYLHRYPIQTIKVDRSFVQDVGPQAERILRGIVSLGHELGKDLIAEGIETEAQAALLQSWGCDLGQGYLFSRPLPLEDWVRFLLK